MLSSGNMPIISISSSPFVYPITFIIPPAPFPSVSLHFNLNDPGTGIVRHGVMIPVAMIKQITLLNINLIPLMAISEKLVKI